MPLYYVTFAVWDGVREEWTGEEIYRTVAGCAERAVGEALILARWRGTSNPRPIEGLKVTAVRVVGDEEMVVEDVKGKE